MQNVVLLNFLSHALNFVILTQNMNQTLLPGKAGFFKESVHLHGKVEKLSVEDVTILSYYLFFYKDMSMGEVREFERTIQRATNVKIGLVTPTISTKIVPSTADMHCNPSSAPSTPVNADSPEFLSLPKDRPRKTSAPNTLTLPGLKEGAN